MKEYNIYGGIDNLEYLYTGLYNDIEEAKTDAWVAISHIVNAYPKVEGNIRFKVILTETDDIEDLIFNYI